MRWRVALIDSVGAWPGAGGAASFVSEGERVVPGAPVADPTGHGTRIAGLITRERAVDLLLGQVFTTRAPATPAAVAVAVDWAVGEGARLVHLSLGLGADRPVLRAAVERALAAGAILVASTPARTAAGAAAVYPAAYAGVIRGTGDARCAPGDLSSLGEGVFGGCPRMAEGGAALAGGRGASIGAAWVSWWLLGLEPSVTAAAAAAALAGAARYVGRERRPHGKITS